jgi:hypothetical protein
MTNHGRSAAAAIASCQPSGLPAASLLKSPRTGSGSGGAFNPVCQDMRAPLIGMRSLAGRKIVALDMDDLVFVERDLQQFVDGLAVAEAI